MARLVLLQCELEHRHQAPHLAMALFATDLSRAGHEVDCALVHPSALDEAAAALRGTCDLLILDSVFPFGMTRRLREAISAPVLIGGHNALQHVLRGPVDAALTGPGRAHLAAAVAGVLEERDRETVPGLWFWEDGLLRCGPQAPEPRPLDDVQPFEPWIDWRYFGPPRAPGSNLRLPSVVADSGCVYNRSALGGANPFYRETKPRLPDLALHPSARKRLLEETQEREGGCTFCAFCFTLHRRPPPGHVYEAVLEQCGRWISLGARDLSLQTEHPLPLLPGLLAAMDERGWAERIDALQVRTIPWLILQHQGLLEQSIEAARRAGIRLVLAQVGFEAFDEPSLAAFNKGISADENERCAALLSEWSQHHSDAFDGTAGHGLIPFHPWSTIQGLRTTLDACKRSAPWLLPGFHPGRRVELYQEWGPLFWKLQDEGLGTESEDGFGWGWRFADPKVEELVQGVAHLRRQNPAWTQRAWEATEAVLAVLESVEAAQDRAQRYKSLALRGPGTYTPPA